MNTLIIQVKRKAQYGKEHHYPVCNKAILFATMLGRKTLTLSDIEYIKALGYTVQLINDQPTEL